MGNGMKWKVWNFNQWIMSYHKQCCLIADLVSMVCQWVCCHCCRWVVLLMKCHSHSTSCISLVNC